jgi:hypothetical protein
MSKKKLSDSQLELIALLPKGLPAMTDGAKLVLSNIIKWYGTDFTNENGYVYRSNADMMKDTEIGGKTRLTNAIRELELKQLITVKRGKFGDRTTATEYRLNKEIEQKINFKSEKNCGTITENSIGTINEICGTIKQNCGTITENETIAKLKEENQLLQLKISELETKIEILTNKIEIMGKNFYSTTDVDTDSEYYYKGILSNALDTSLEPETSNAVDSSFSSLNFEKENHADTNTTNEDVTPSISEETPKPETISESISSGVSQLSEKPVYIQPLNENPPQIAPRPPFNDWFAGIKREIRQGIFQWSITLTDDVVKTDDANMIVRNVFENHPEWENYVGQFQFTDLTTDAIRLMENRVKNADVRQAIKENQYQERHKKVMEQLLKTA